MQSRKLEYDGQLFQITHTSSFVTTLTEESSDVIPLIFRGKQIETTIVHTQTRSVLEQSRLCFCDLYPISIQKLNPSDLMCA